MTYVVVWEEMDKDGGLLPLSKDVWKSQQKLVLCQFL